MLGSHFFHPARATLRSCNEWTAIPSKCLSSVIATDGYKEFRRKKPKMGQSRQTYRLDVVLCLLERPASRNTDALTSHGLTRLN